MVQFDTTEQDFKLREAEADLAEAEQHILQATAQREAEEEEDRYALAKAKSDIELAELEVRKNPILAAITARQNTLALEAARDHLAQLEHNMSNRKANNEASIAIQEAGRGKAESQAKTARQNIDAMTLRAHRAGYVSLQENTTGNLLYFGMTLAAVSIGRFRAAWHGDRGDSRFEELGAEREDRRTGSRPSGCRRESRDHDYRGPGSTLHRTREGDRGNHRPAVGSPFRL